MVDRGPSAPSSTSTSTPPPPSPPESFACFRTSFQDKYVRNLLTFPRSWRMRKIRSSAERYRAPRRLARARACTIWIQVSLTALLVNKHPQARWVGCERYLRRDLRYRGVGLALHRIRTSCVGVNTLQDLCCKMNTIWDISWVYL